MTVTANSAGVVAGKFTIPANVRAGSKSVVFQGSGGSRGTGTFFGQGQLTVETMRQITTITQTFIRVDPLAQTFSLDAQRQLGAAELYVVTKGTSPIVVQIRETSTGFPTQTVLAEGRLAPSAITINAWNRFIFDAPVMLASGVEYALVVLCNDAVASVAVAELGKYDTANGRWVTGQPYQVGVLLSSSNASTWTAHQDRDMAFRLLATRYTQTERTFDLGTVAVTGATDLMVLALQESPATGANSEIQLTMPDTTVITVGDAQVVRLSGPVTGNIGVKARVKATAIASALVAPTPQVIAGQLASTAEYVTRAIPADAAGCNVRVILDGQFPSGSGVAVYLSGVDVGDTWVAVAQAGSATPIGENYYEYQYYKTGVLEARVRVKLVITGSPAARPYIKNLRVSIT